MDDKHARRNELYRALKWRDPRVYRLAIARAAAVSLKQDMNMEEALDVEEGFVSFALELLENHY